MRGAASAPGACAVAIVVVVVVESVLVFRGALPGVGLICLVEFPLHVFHHALLKRRDSAVQIEEGLVAAVQLIEAQELPLQQTFRLLDGAEGIACQDRPAFAVAAEVLAILTLQHDGGLSRRVSAFPDLR